MSARRVLAPLALIVAALWPSAMPAAAADPPPPGECPDTMPIGDVHEGQTGVGWTVPRGTDPQPFAVEVIGVYPDGAQPNHDLILIRVSDLPGHQFIEKNGGLWQGASGSPIYIDDKLIGAYGWGFSASPSTLGGVTPIADMRNVGDHDISQATFSEPLRRKLRQASPAALQPSDFGQLGIPMFAPEIRVRGPRGGTARQRAAIRAKFDVRKRLADRGVTVIPVDVGSRAARAARVAKPSATGVVPGGNFYASMTSGAVDWGGLGTATLVCDQRILAFGHPFWLTGASNLGAHDATALDIVDDKTFPAYKLGVPGPLVGKVTQDRGAAIAARLDLTPQVFEVATSISRQSGGPTRDGATKIYIQFPRWFASGMPFEHAYWELLEFIDAYEDGSVGLDLDVSGHREDGSPFHVSFGDRWIGADRPNEAFWDSVSAGTYGVGLLTSWLTDFPGERIAVDSVEADLDIGGAGKWEITDIAVRRNGGVLQTGSPVCVKRGDTLTVVVDLESKPGGDVTQREFEITVPKIFGALNVKGGKGIDPFIDVSAFEDFDGLLRYLRRSSRADEALVRIVKDGAVQRSNRTLLDRVIEGTATVNLEPLGSGACA